MSASLAGRLRKQADELNALADLLEPRVRMDECMLISDAASLAERIELRLDLLNMSARAASMAAGDSPDMIRNILRAAREGKPYSPRVKTLHAIASVLGCSLAWLANGTHEVAA